MCARKTSLALAVTCAALCSASQSSAHDWLHYGGNQAGTRFVSASQITPENVHLLERAWVYRTGDNLVQDPMNLPAFESTAVKLDDTLYLCTPHNMIIALNAASGRQRWRFDARTDSRGHYLVTCRGVALHVDTNASTDSPRACKRRVIAATLDGRLLALDADSGKRCSDFGDKGKVDLKAFLGEVKPGFYSVTSPPTVVGDVVVVGGLVLDNQSVDVPSGVVRAFNVRTGALLWAWDAGAADGRSYQRGSPNAWSVFSADASLGLIYIPTGNRSPDYYGANRSASEDRFSSSVVALDVATGTLRWAFQTVHHDLWDYDVASQPVLTEFDGKPALVQATKSGQLYVLDRRTGKPLSEVQERPVPASTIAGERASPTQPFSTQMPALHPQRLSEEDIWGLTPLDRYFCLREFRRYRHEGLFTPPSLEGTVNYPSNLGASSWGSVSIDPQRQILVANTNRIASVVKLLPRAQADALAKEGIPLYNPSYGTPYAVQNSPFLSALGIPCTAPPWGVLTAIDLRSRKTLWEIPFGTTRDLAPLGLALNLGVPNQGGSIVTASGLIFIGAAADNYVRAYDTQSGRELWKARLPAGGQATPMSYIAQADGRQYLVIAAGGHRHLGTSQGDYVMAFALPDRVVQQP